MKLIDKDAIIAEIKRRIDSNNEIAAYYSSNSEHDYLCRVKEKVYKSLLSFIDTLEVKDPYEQCVQYDSIKAGIQAHAETYSFNIQSELFNQLTKEQQALWRKEIEQAVISGGDAGVTLARDSRYKENLEVKEINFEKEVKLWIDENTCNGYCSASIYDTAEHFFELGIKTKEGNTLAKAKGFLVRDKDDYTAIYSTKPERGKTEWVDGNHPRNANESSCLFTMDARILPNVEFYDEPVEVEVTITKKGE